MCVEHFNARNISEHPNARQHAFMRRSHIVFLQILSRNLALLITIAQHDSTTLLTFQPAQELVITVLVGFVVKIVSFARFIRGSHVARRSHLRLIFHSSFARGQTSSASMITTRAFLLSSRSSFLFTESCSFFRLDLCSMMNAVSSSADEGICHN